MKITGRRGLVVPAEAVGLDPSAKGALKFPDTGGGTGLANDFSARTDTGYTGTLSNGVPQKLGRILKAFLSVYGSRYDKYYQTPRAWLTGYDEVSDRK
nr:hypothetical protein [Tanacetum cinerariifolium]